MSAMESAARRTVVCFGEALIDLLARPPDTRDACGALACTRHGAFAAMPGADEVRQLLEAQP